MQTGFSRIAIKFFLILVPVAIVTTSAATAFLGYLRYQEKRETLVHEVTDDARISARTLAEPMWSMNRIVVEDIVAALAADHHVSCVDLHDDVSGTVHPGGGSSCTGNAYPGPKVSTDVVYAGDPIGRLVVGIDDHRVIGELTEAVVGALWLFAALMIANLVAAVMALRSTVLIPLERLLTAIRAAGQKAFRKPVEWAARDELGTVIAAYNEMIVEIGTHEEALRASEERFRGSFEGTAVGMAIVENDRSFSLVNEGLCNILGYSESELLAKTFLDVTHPEDREESIRRSDEFLSGDLEHFSIEKRYLRKNGETLWAIVSGSKIRDPEGNTVHTVRQIQDITGRKQAEHALRESEKFRRELISGAEESIFMIDREGRVVEANDKGAMRLGTTVEQLIGRIIFDFMPPDVGDRRRAGLKAILTGGEDTVSVDQRGDRWFETLAQPHGDEHGRVERVSIFSRDITERRRAEETIRRANEDLEREVAARTAELAKSEQRYRTLVDRMQDGLFLALDGKLDFVNHAFAEIIGYEVDELVGMDSEMVIAPEDRDFVVDRYRRRMTGEVMPTSYEFNLLHKDGTSRVSVLANMGMFEFPDGRRGSLGTIKDITERKEADREIAESEERFRNLAEGSIQGIVVHRDHEPLFVNRMWADIHGYGVDEILEMESVVSLISPADQERMVEYKDARLSGKSAPARYEYQAVRKDGSWIWLENLVRVVSWDGEPAIQSTVIDATERKQAEIGLKAAKEQYQDLYETAPNAYCSISYEDGSVLLHNAAFPKLLGYEPEEFAKLKVFDFYADTPDGLPKAKALLEELKKGREVNNAELQMKRKDGEIIWVSLSVKPQRDADGMIEHSRSVIIDITERHRLMDALMRAEQSLRDGIESIPAGFALWDRDNRLVMCNENFRNIYGTIAPDIVEGQCFDHLVALAIERGQFVLDESSNEWIQQWEQNPGTLLSGYEQHLSDGKYVLASNRRTAEGGTVSVRADITEAVRTQFELAEKQTRLISHTRELEANAAQLEQTAAELQVERDKANAASTAKSQFLATMSHELRTPLTAIIGFSGLMVQKLFGPLGSDKYVEYATFIKNSGDHLLTLVEDILEMTKVEAGKYEIHREAFVLVDLVAEAFMFVTGKAGQNRISLANDVPAELPLLFADKRAIKQVLINLIHNAVKFSDGGNAVTVAAGKSDTGFVISVTDMGGGISPEDIDKALEPFSQIDRKHHASQEGTGLGLSLCKALVELHGGSLSIESEVGKGTTVTIRLPMTTQVAWHPSMSIGVDPFDSDHQILMTLAV